MKKAKLFEIFIHILFWILWPVIILMQDQEITIGVFHSTDKNFYWPLFYGTIFNMLIFYVSASKILPYFFRRKKYLYGIAVSSMYFLTISLFEGLIDRTIILNFCFPTDSDQIAKRLSENVFLTNFVLNIPILLLVYTYRITKDWYRNEKLRQRLNEEKLSSELQFLKSQINPHFLFNSLNNLFGMARQANTIPVADGIAKLSNLMRYMLYDSEVDKVSIDKEIDYLKDYIELQKLRIQSLDNVRIDLKIEHNSAGLKVAPLLLIPFVENAFKHGISIKDKSSIEIHIKTFSDKIDFYISNSINKLRKNREDENSGFGLKNVKKRLELIYPFKHKLGIKQTEDKFMVWLTIDSKL